MSELENRVVELEIRLAHHERMAEDLSAVLAEQTRTIDRLTRQVVALADRIAELEAGATRQDDKPPPHY